MKTRESGWHSPVVTMLVADSDGVLRSEELALLGPTELTVDCHKVVVLGPIHKDRAGAIPYLPGRVGRGA